MNREVCGGSFVLAARECPKFAVLCALVGRVL
jgi:hypothetical protein